jgi:hypothetical protein
MKISNLALAGTLSVVLVALLYQKTIEPNLTDNDAWIAEVNAREEKLNQKLQPYIERNKRLPQQPANNSATIIGSEPKIN